ncbi:TauD/TfdA family dioxygenase [Bacillus piscicola]|uniref:TauD/TfdA family dioxygenase n=1 Tax=Bacillus piscicola TaxID=1632684 RepID=UPI001F08B5C9|nr:TauD/TfdA family dioxygenase [Bacillus piscicola]
MLTMKKEIIQSPAAWKGSELSGSDSWIYYLSDKTINEFEKAMREVQKKGLKAPDFNKEDFPIDKLTDEISHFIDELENGRGFLLLRGLPMERYTDEEASIIYYGLGLHMGKPVTQNPKGDLLGNVTAIGDPSDKKTRVYQTNSYLPYHTDLSDVVGLLSLRKAKTGGESSLVSAITIYNEILENYPEYLGVLYRPIYFAHLGEELPTLSPIFSYHKDKLSCRYMRQYIELGQEMKDVQLSNIEIEALDLIDSLLHDEDNRLDMILEPGDIQFANNYMVLHSRTHFEDHEDPALKRHLLRLWLKMPNARELAPEFPGRNGFPRKKQLS